MEVLLIGAKREGYSPKQCPGTMTVGDLIDYLSGYDEEMRVYISNDEGYTYGSITEWDIGEKTFSEDA